MNAYFSRDREVKLMLNHRRVNWGRLLVLILLASCWAGCRKKAPEETAPPLNRPSPFERTRNDLSTADVHAAPEAWKGVQEIAIGEHFLCGLANGNVYCWGNGRFGELGMGEAHTQSLVPIGPLPNMRDVVTVSANRGFACALESTGNVACWGNNVHGQLGDGTKTNRMEPTYVQGLDDVTHIATGYQHACAVTRAGHLYCWGENADGQLGKSEGGIYTRPQRVPGITRPVQVAAGTASTCVRQKGGHVECWGANTFGELGRGVGPDKLKTSPRPARVKDISQAADISGYADHYCIATEDGEVACWGGKTDLSPKELRRRDRRLDANLPVEPLPEIGAIDLVPGIDGIARVAVGKEYSCALEEAGQVYCWGENTYAQHGSGSQSDRDDPSPMAGVTNATRVMAGSRNTCVIVSDGRTLCAGANKQGEIGNGGTSTALTPKPVLQPEKKSSQQRNARD